MMLNLVDVDSYTPIFCHLQAIMKSYVTTGSDRANPENFLAYMAPAPGEVDVFCQILNAFQF